MSNPHGTPIWYELITADPAKAQAFYETVVGWTAVPFANDTLVETGGYTVFNAPDGQGVAGLMKAPDPGPPLAGTAILASMTSMPPWQSSKRRAAASICRRQRWKGSAGWRWSPIRRASLST